MQLTEISDLYCKTSICGTAALQHHLVFLDHCCHHPYQDTAGNNLYLVI